MEERVQAGSDSEGERSLIGYLYSSKFIQASANATRLVAKLRNAVQNEELYETQQILRTIYFRFINNGEKIEPLLGLLYHGALHLLDHDEYISGQDIASLFLETSAKRLQNRLDSSADQRSSETVKQILLEPSIAYHSDNPTMDIDICRRISEIVVRLPVTDIGQTKFVAEALKLLPPKILNRELLHDVLARKYWLAKDYVNARYHFLHCANTSNFQLVAEMLVEFHVQQGNKSELDLFITQFILQFLCLQHPIDPPATSTSLDQSRHQRAAAVSSNIAVSRRSRATIKLIATRIFSEYVLKHPSITSVQSPYESPLLNLTYFTISILDSNKSEANAFKLLNDTYHVAWGRDPNFQNYLNRIGVIYFGLIDQSKQQQQQQQGTSGLFNNILMSMFDSAEDDDDEDVTTEQTGNIMSSLDELD